jgi:aromatic-L-amino-acid/L-tryptophan decarboxylase
MEKVEIQKSESLDPENWDALRHLGHQMVDDMMEYLKSIRDRPLWQPLPEDVKDQFKQPLPIDPQGYESTYQDFLRYVQPYLKGNTHPRFWGWVEGTGTPFGMLAELLAAGLNPNVNFGEQSPVYVELQVLDWFKEMFGYPAEAGGLLVSGGSVANLIGLAVARNTKASFNVALEGLHAAQRRLVLYGSDEMHNSLQKAVELLGLGRSSLRRIPVNAGFQIDVELLKAAIAEDRARGDQPFCVIGNAGTVNSGAIDALEQLADICQKEGLWLHVDGAFGALAALAPKLRPLLRGIERADSLAFDLHKWLHVPYEAGCILIRDAERQHEVFSPSGAYLSHVPRGLAAGPIWFGEYGIQLSRNFKALKVWMLLKEHGIKKYGRLVQQNVDQAHHLATLIETSPQLELLTPVVLNVVCFRYIKEHLDSFQLDELNREILFRLHESGIAAPSYTILHGKYALRVAITNHRSRREDFEVLINEVIASGRIIVANQWPLLTESLNNS